MTVRVQPRLRAAVIGAGFVGTQHIEALHRIGVEVAIVATSEPRGAQAAARSLGAERWTTDWASAATDHGVDVVHVCVPNNLHRDVVLTALDGNKHVICEKPLGVDVVEGRDLVAAAAQVDRVTVLCHNYRFFPMAAELRMRVGAGQLGTVHTVRGVYLQDWLLSPAATNWRVDAARGGRSRAVADIGSHWIDLAETVSHQRVTEVVADTSIVFSRRPGHQHGETFAKADGDEAMVEVGTEDQAGLLIRFDGGAHGTLALSQVAAGHANDLQLAVDGTSGSATWQQERPDQLVLSSGGSRETLSRAPDALSAGVGRLAQLPAGHNEGWADALRNLLGAAYEEIRGGRDRDAAEAAPLPTFSDGLRHTAFVEATMCSAAEGRWVTVDEVLAAGQPMQPVT